MTRHQKQPACLGRAQRAAEAAHVRQGQGCAEAGGQGPPRSAEGMGSSTGQGPARKERRASGTMSRMLPNSGRCPTKRGRDSTSMEQSLTPARQLYVLGDTVPVPPLQEWRDLEQRTPPLSLRFCHCKGGTTPVLAAVVTNYWEFRGLRSPEFLSHIQDQSGLTPRCGQGCVPSGGSGGEPTSIRLRLVAPSLRLLILCSRL